MTPMPTTTRKAIVRAVNANQFESSARTIPAEITAIAAAASFDPNFKPTAGGEPPRRGVVPREDEVGEPVERGQDRGGVGDRASQRAPQVDGVDGAASTAASEQGQGVHPRRS